MAYVVLRNRQSITELAPSCTARSSLIMSAKRLLHAYERMPVNVNSDSEEVSASSQQATPRASDRSLLSQLLVRRTLP